MFTEEVPHSNSKYRFFCHFFVRYELLQVGQLTNPQKVQKFDLENFYKLTN